MEEYVLCMVKKIGSETYRFYFCKKEDLLNFYGEDFEQKPSSIVRDLVPSDGCYDFAFNAVAKGNRTYCTSEKSSVYSFQDSLDNCVALMFERNAEKNRLVLQCGEDMLETSDKLFKCGLTPSDDFPQKSPTSFLNAKLKELEEQDENVLAFVRLDSSVKINDETTEYTYKLYFVQKARLQEFKEYNDWFDKQDTMNYAPFDLNDFEFDSIATAKSTNIMLDTIEQQNEYSVNESLDGCVCMASENIDGKEYPEFRLVLNAKESFVSVMNKLQKKGFTCL